MVVRRTLCIRMIASLTAGEVVWRWPKEPVIGDNAARIHGFTADHLILTTGPYWAPVCGNGSIVVLNAGGLPCLFCLLAHMILKTDTVPGVSTPQTSVPHTTTSSV